MPDLVVGSDGEKYLLQRALNVPWLAGEDWQVHLYQNNYIPTKDVTLADLTQATFAGYSPITIPRSQWGAAFNLGGRAVSFLGAPTPTWLSAGAPQTIYGIYLTVPSLGILLWAQRYDVPVVVTNAVPAIASLSFSLHSESEP